MFNGVNPRSVSGYGLTVKYSGITAGFDVMFSYEGRLIYE